MKLWKQAVEARKNSYSPYSHYAVGAALLAKSSKVFRGANVENASYGGAICAERTAIVKAISEGQKTFTDICVVIETRGSIIPCGFCLQVMSEFFKPDTKIWVGTPKKLKGFYYFKDLLPVSFGPKELKA